MSPQSPSTPQVTAPRVQPVVSDAGEQTQAAGENLLRSGARLSRVNDELQDRYDETLAREADAQLSEELRGLLEDPEKGYLGTVGRDAQDRRKGLDSEVEARVKAVGARMQTDMQRSLFARAAQARRADVRSAADRHEAVQRRHWEAGAAASRAEANSRDAVAFFGQEPEPGQPPAADRYFRAAIADARQSAKTLGQDEDAAERAVLDQVHGLRLGRLVREGKAAAAKSYLGAVRGDLSADVGEKLAQFVAGASVDSEAWEAARAAQNQAPGDLVAQRQILEQQRLGGGTVSFADGRHVKVGALDQEAYDRAQARLQRDDEDAFRQEQRTKDTTLKQFATQAAVNGWTSWDSVDAESRAAIDRAGVRPQVDLLFLTGGTAVTSNTGFQRLEQLERNPSEMVGKPFEDFQAELGHHLDRGDQGKLSSLWAKANQRQAPTLPDAFTDDAVREHFKAAGWVTVGPDGKIPTEQLERMKTTQHLVRKHLLALEAASGKKPGQAELAAAIVAQTAVVDSVSKLPFNSLTREEMKVARIPVPYQGRTYTVIGPGTAPSYGAPASEVVFDEEHARKLMQARLDAGGEGDESTASLMGILVEEHHEQVLAAEDRLRKQIDETLGVRRRQGRAAELQLRLRQQATTEAQARERLKSTLRDLSRRFREESK